MIKIGNCGWGFAPIKAKDEGVRTKLQAYAKHFKMVEINSTFYRVPKLSTVNKWREEADEVSEDFEFTLKIFQDITHKKRFGEESVPIFDSQTKIANALRAKILLFQCAKSFTPEPRNLRMLKTFFNKIEHRNFVFVVEVRWHEQWTREIVTPLFEELQINQCVDPLRQPCFYAREVAYYRLHGFGSRMYNYKFSDDELKKLHHIVKDGPKPTYILFNNFSAYEDAKRFEKISEFFLL